MAGNMIIVPYSAQYEAQCLHLIEDIQKNEMNLTLGRADQEELMHINSYYTGAGSCFWVVLAGDTVIGTIGLKATHGIGVLKKMYIHADHRGAHTGLAARMLATVIDHARDNQLKFVCLGTNSTLARARRFYEKNGWTQIDRKDVPEPVLDSSFNIADDTFYKIDL
ncbi:acyl-CoA N-acyltransferase [Gongronella butleri]|nr:acyl-CoA N-acyltransferase [Gongronella butleri]